MILGDRVVVVIDGAERAGVVVAVEAGMEPVAVPPKDGWCQLVAGPRSEVVTVRLDQPERPERPACRCDAVGCTGECCPDGVQCACRLEWP